VSQIKSTEFTYENVYNLLAVRLECVHGERAVVEMAINVFADLLRSRSLELIRDFRYGEASSFLAAADALDGRFFRATPTAYNEGSPEHKAELDEAAEQWRTDVTASAGADAAMHKMDEAGA